MTYFLERLSDGSGDSGGMSIGFRYENNKVVEEVNDFRPKVGWFIRVGSLYARSYSTQDWWQTTIITEIIKETKKQIRFKTKNSEYIWRCD